MDAITKEQLLTMLERLLSITEPYIQHAPQPDHGAWSEIAVKVADLRDGENV